MTSTITDNGFYLGRFWDVERGRAREHVFAPVENESNTLLIGPPGSGKTNLLISNTALMHRPMMLFDMKGEISAVVAPMLKRKRHADIRVINPWNVQEEARPYLADSGWNPLRDTFPQNPDYGDDITNLTIAINASHGQGGQNSFFTDGATIAGACVLEDLRSGDANANLAMFRDIICEPYGIDRNGDPIGLLKRFVRLTKSGSSSVRAKAGRFATGTKSSQETIASLTLETGCLDSGPLRRSLHGPGIDWQRFKNSASVVSVIIPADKLNSHKSYSRMLVTTAVRELMRSPPSKEVPGVALMLDEFPQLGFLGELISAAATARGFGVRLMPIVVQDLSQLRAVYGGDRWETFITTANCICSYAPRSNFTAEYLSNLCGDKIIGVTTRGTSINGKGEGSVNTNTNYQYRKLFEPSELMRMPRGRMLCLLNGMLPFFTQVPNYWEASFASQLAANPYHPGGR